MRRLEWETLLPKLGPFPHMSQTDAMTKLLVNDFESARLAGYR